MLRIHSVGLKQHVQQKYLQKCIFNKSLERRRNCYKFCLQFNVLQRAARVIYGKMNEHKTGNIWRDSNICKGTGVRPLVPIKHTVKGTSLSSGKR
jgi:hypothetical protein